MRFWAAPLWLLIHPGSLLSHFSPETHFYTE